jgi:hypothetical protein
VTALGRKCVAVGWFNNETLADAAITAGDVYKDANNEVRCAGRAGTISHGALVRVQPDASVLTQRFVPPPRGRNT